MNKFICLSKVLLKTGGNLGLDGGQKTKGKKILFLILIAACFIPMAVSFAMFSAEAYDMLAAMQQENLILGFGLSSVCFMIFFFGIFYVMSVFYFSMDIENLLPLPLKPSEILGAKFIAVLFYEYYTEAIFFLPIIIAFGVKSGAGIIFYIYSLIIFLILPVIPLTVAGFIDMIIMRFTNIGKNKDRFRVVAGIIAIVFAIGLNLLLQNMGEKIDEKQLIDMFMQGNNSLVGLSTKTFPSSKFAVNSLVNSSNINGLINLILFIAISAAVLSIFIILGNMLYFKGVMGISETGSKRRRLTDDEMEKNLEQSSPIKTYTLRELRILFRTPAYFLNCVLINFIFPIFVLVLMFMQNGRINEIKEFRKLLQPDKGYLSIVLGISFIFLVFLSSANGITSTSISREGKKLFVLKYIPVSYGTQLISKVMSGVILSCVGMSLLLITAFILFKIPVYLFFMILILGVIGIFFGCFIGILIDLNHPKLSWDNEQKAVKQNINLLLNMVAVLILPGVTVFAVYYFNLSLMITFILILVLYIILDIILYYLVITKGAKVLERIEA